jgi:hypothetical protein
MHQPHVLCRIAPLLVVALLPTPCWATSSMTLSGGANRTPSTDQNPTSGSNSAGLSGYHDLSERWSLDGSFGWTRPLTATVGDPVFSKKELEPSVLFLSLGTTWTPGGGDVTVTVDEDGSRDTEELPAHWSFSAGLSLSPSATGRTSTTVTLQDTLKGGQVVSYDAPALLQVKSGTAGATFSVSYDTSGDSPYETLVTLSASPSRVSTSQAVVEYQDRFGNLRTQAQLKDACATATAQNPKLFQQCKRLEPLLGTPTDAIVNLPVSLSIDHTLWSKTVVGLSGTWHFYSKDPASVGYFNLASQGRKAPDGQTLGGSSASFGTGVAIAAFQWNAGASVSHSFGALKASVAGGYATYYDGGGHYTSVTARLAYKLNAHWRATASVATQADTDSDDTTSRSWSGSAGIKYTF